MGIQSIARPELVCQMYCDRNGSCVYFIPPDDPVCAGFCSMPMQFLCTESLKDKLPSVSYSSLHDFMRCRELYYLRNILGLRRKPKMLAEPMKAGGTWDAWLRTGDPTEYIKSTDPTWQTISKVKALARVAKELELRPAGGTAQLRVSYPIHGTILTGYVDRAYDDHFDEDKLSARPDFYTKRQNIEHQCATYFMANELWEYVDVKVVRLPGLETGKGKNSDEDDEQYGNRLYQDICKRPSWYFLGLDRKNKTYGQRFYRTEFDLDGLFKQYVFVLDELKTCIQEGRWYTNTVSCYCPGECDYVSVCANGVVSDEVFEQIQKQPKVVQPVEIKEQGGEMT